MSHDQLDDILEALMAYARQDFSPRVHVSERRDLIDAIATGINLLAEELDGEVASRRELEAAYARLQTTQAQLVIAEKFAAVGQLASGVAHELNNPATWVLLGLQGMERRISRARTMATNNPPLLDEICAIERTLTDSLAGLERMRDVIADLRTLSHVDRDVLAPLALEQVVRSACNLARPAYQHVAELVLDLESVPPVLGEAGRIGQLVTNLVVNAAHAVADRPGPQQIIVSTRVEASGDVLLAVEDTGPGIAEELYERVFDPYFSTKTSDVGSGLGLAIVRDIAGRHGGTARITRSAAGGARVEVRLRRASGVVAAIVPTAAAPHRTGQRARVLLVDDEPMLLRSMQEAVRDEHDVVIAHGGRAALDLLESDQRFDLVVCDLQMPNVDGVAVYETLSLRCPELVRRFVVMTGGAVTPRAASFLQREKPRLLTKPIDLDELLELAARPVI